MKPSTDSKSHLQGLVNSVQLSRRNLIKHAGLAGGGLTLATVLPGCGSIVSREIDDEGNWVANAWLTISSEGKVSFVLDRVEMGQGTSTGIVTLLAEELGLEPEQVSVTFAGADQQYRNPDYGLQLTGGSNSLSSSWGPVREIGATAREMLITAASEVFQVPTSYLKAENAAVVHASSGKKISFGKLADLASKQDIPESAPLTPSSEFRLIGKRNQRLDSPDKVRGQAGFGIDVVVPDMVFAVLARSPYVGGSLESFELNGAENAPGVQQILEISSGLAVVASSYWQARQALEKITLRWKRSEEAASSTKAVFDLYRSVADQDDGEQIRDDGSFDDAMEAAQQVIEQEYRAPFLAHATMEPMNCVARIQEGRADIWCGTQAPDLAQVAVAKATDVSLDEVHIHNQYLGGGFGRRLSQDFIAEAAEIAYKSGKTVKLVWSREDDMQNDLYRPASLHRMRATLDQNGQLSGWDHLIVCPSIMDWYIWDAAPAMFPWAPKMMYSTLAKTGLMTQGTPMTPADRSPYEGAEDLAYAIPSLSVRHAKADAGIPVSYWRSVGHSHNGFVTEAFMDELAHAAGKDVYEFKRDYLKSSPRLQHVLNVAAQKGAWGKPSAEGRFQGIAAHKSFGSYVAELVELSVEGGRIQVHKVTCVIDCGVIVNPDIVRMQMESCIAFGITAALYGEIDLEDGKIKQSNFHDYQMLRMDQSPEIDVMMVDSQEAPTGVGEPGLPPLAPAMAGALFAATGKRFRSMPFRLA